MSSRIVPPSAAALIGSLRGVGYSLETAIADLIDNSIAANALSIDVRFDWANGNPVASVLDDGTGMSEDRLVEAMRFGGVGPDATRSAGDLGRFGLGLKTASLSQCRQLTVVSKTIGGMAAFTWDIDRIRKAGDRWILIEGLDRLNIDALSELETRQAGTLVVWRKIDFGRKNDRPDHAAFLADLDRLDRHLSMVFHRFLDGDARRIRIGINGHDVLAWDPFLEGYEATIRNPEQPIKGPGGTVVVRGFVLPHRDRFKSEVEFEKAGGPDGWNVQQGFYVYRQKRLLSAGGWLGLGKGRAWTREESSRLARIRIDIPNSADHDWRIDIRKAIARPPDAIRKWLQNIADDIRRKAREVFVHRGQYGARARTDVVSRIWLVNPSAKRHRYTIRRDHELVALIREQLDATGRDLLDAVFDLIERTVPVDRVWLDVTEHGVPPCDTESDDLSRAALSMLELMERAGIPHNEAIEKLTAMDPFDQIKHLPDLLAKRFEERRL